MRTYNKSMPIEEAVSIAVDECIKEEILADFLRRNKAEAIRMSIYEYDQELHDKTLFEEGCETGKIEGKVEDILILLESLGPVPDEVSQKIMKVTDEQSLVELLKLAAKVESLEEYSQCLNDVLK